MICPNCKKRSLSVARNWPSITSAPTMAFSYLGQGRWAEMDLNVCTRCGYSQWVKTHTVGTGFVGGNAKGDGDDAQEEWFESYRERSQPLNACRAEEREGMQEAERDNVKGEGDDIRKG